MTIDNVKDETWIRIASRWLGYVALAWVSYLIYQASGISISEQLARLSERRKPSSNPQIRVIPATPSALEKRLDEVFSASAVSSNQANNANAQQSAPSTTSSVPSEWVRLASRKQNKSNFVLHSPKRVKNNEVPDGSISSSAAVSVNRTETDSDTGDLLQKAAARNQDDDVDHKQKKPQQQLSQRQIAQSVNADFQLPEAIVSDEASVMRSPATPRVTSSMPTEARGPTEAPSTSLVGSSCSKNFDDRLCDLANRFHVTRCSFSVDKATSFGVPVTLLTPEDVCPPDTLIATDLTSANNDHYSSTNNKNNNTQHDHQYQYHIVTTPTHGTGKGAEPAAPSNDQVASEYESLTETAVAVDKSTSLNLVSQSNSGKRPGKHLTNNNGNGDAPLTSHEHDSINDNAHSHKNENNNNESNNNNTDPSYRAFQAHASHSANANTYCEVNGSGRLSPVASLLVCPDSDNALSCSSSSNSNEIAVSVDNKTTATRSIVTNRTAVAAGASCASIQTKATVAHAVSTTTSTADASNQHVSLSDSFDKVVGASTNADAGDPATVAPFRDQDSSDRQDNRQQDSWGKTRLSHSILDLVDTDEGQQGQQQQQQQRPQQNHRQEPSGFQSRHMGNGESCPQLEQSSTSKQQLVNHSCTLQSGRGFADIGSVDMINERCGTDSRGDIHQPTAGQIGQARKLSPTIAAACRRTSTSGALAEDTYLSAADVSTATASRCVGLVPGRRTGGDPLLVQVLCDINDVDEYHQLTRRESVDEPWPLPGLPSFHSDVGSKADFGSDVFGLGHSERGTIETGVRKRTQPQERQGDLSSNRGNCAIKNKTSGLDGDFAVELDCSSVKTSGEVGGSKCRVQSPHSGNVTAAQVISDGEDKISSKSPEQTPENHVTESLKVKQEAEAVRWDLLRRSNTGQEKSDSLDSSCEEEGVAVNQQNDYLTGGTNEVDSAVSEKTKQQVSLPDFRTPPPWPRPTFHNDFSVGLETMDINANNNESINSQNEEISSVPQLHVINVLDGILFQGGVERRVLRTFESGGDYEMVYRDKLDRLTVGNDHSLNEMRSNSSTPDSTRDQRNRKAIREEDFSDLLPPLSPDPGYDSYSDRLLGSPDDCFERLVRSASPVQLRVITEEEEADRPQSAPISSNTKQSLGYEETTMVRVNSSATTAPTTTGTPSDKEDREPGRDVMAQIDSALMAQLSKKFDGITQMSDSDVNGFYVTRVATAKDVANAGASTQINDKANTEARSVDESGRMTKKAITDVLQPVVTESPMSECEANADDIEIMMDNSASFLRAARAGNLEKVLEYLKGSIDINTSNANGLNALHLASKEGHVPVVKELLHRGAEVNAATKKGNTALHIASLAGQTDVVRLLVEKGANVNAQSQNGFTPLYMAAQENHDAVVRLLLANNASQSLATEDGFTPLAVALQQGHDKVVAVLLENDAKGKVRLPALHIAAKKDDTKAAALLLQTHEHNPDVTSKSGFTPLHIAAHYGNANIAALLLEKGADVNFPAKHQITPLHVAAKWGKANMVKLLLEEGAKLDASTRDGLTPLHCAARSGHDQVVDQLIEKGAPITAKTKNGLAPLHMASQGDHVESAKILLNHKAPVDEITVDYLTALHVAAHCGHVGVAKLLLEKKADANSRALNGFTPLHIACKKNRIKVVELLLRHGASIEATTESGLTPLHVASFMGCMNIVIYLIQHGANADVPTVRGETPLHLAARANQTDIVRILLRNGAQVDTKAREQQTPLHIAARLGNTDIVGLLLQHGAHVDSATKDQYTALHIAAKEGQEDVVNMLLDHGASVTAKTKKGFTPLHLAAKYGNLRVAKLLLQKEADVDAQGKNGVTPLHVAAHYDHNDVALLLLEQGASPHAAAKNGYTSLHIAAKKNQMDIGSTLLEYGAKTNAESKAGFSALHLAVQEGHAEMAALLIEHGANVDAAAKNGLTPLHLCAQEDKVNVAAILAKHNARIDPATAAGYTPLHVACHFGQTNMIRFLLQHGADVNATTTHGYTPLHQAAQQGHTMIINLLLENRAQPNATTNQGQTALSIAQKLGYISVIETLKVVTETTVTTTTTVVTEEKYKVVAPETMHETFMSDSEDEGEQDNMMGDHSFKYLTADEMKSLGDDSLPIDVTRDERLHEAHVAHIASQQAATRPHGHIAPSAQEEDRLSPSHLDQSFAKAAPDNVEVKRTPVHAGGEGKLKWKTFLVSFMVDARGGAMRGCRHSGVRVIIPPRRASMPMRVTCRFIRKEKLAHPPPLMEGEACAARIIEMGPAGAKFLGPVVIEVPHFASLRGKEREIVILRSDNGEAWKEHTMEATEDAVSEVLNGSFDAQELNAMQDFNTNRVTRILTTDFPQYFAVVCRNRQEVHSIGPEGGMVSSTVVSQVQAIFPDGALTKKIKVGLQAQPIHTDVVTRLLGNRVAVSPIVTVEPRRRKFHKPITLTIPLPRAAHKGMTNQYSGDAPTLRLLCSITGGQTKAQWEDVTGSTPLTFVNDCVSFTTTVSARFWLIDCRQVSEVTKFAGELYQEAVLVPFMAKFVVFAKRHESLEAQLRVFCMTDDREEKTLESQEHFAEVAKSRDVEVLEGTQQYLEFAGNLVPITKSGEQLALTFEAFKENRVAFNARVKDMHQEPMGRVAFMKEPRSKHQDAPQTPVCNLNIKLPEPVEYMSVPLEKKYGFVQETGLRPQEMIHRGDLHLSDTARELGADWSALARQLNIPTQEIQQIKDEILNDNSQQALTMLRIWIQRMGPAATGNALEKALQNIGREDIVQKCMSNTEVVTDEVERALAKVHLSGAVPASVVTVTRTTLVTTSSADERDIMKDAESAEDTSSGSAKVKPTATPAPVDEFFGITRGPDDTQIEITSYSTTTSASSSTKTSLIEHSPMTKLQTSTTKIEAKKDRAPVPLSNKEKGPEPDVKVAARKESFEDKKPEPLKREEKKPSPKREIPPLKKEPPKKEKKDEPRKDSSMPVKKESPKKETAFKKDDSLKKEPVSKKEESAKKEVPKREDLTAFKKDAGTIKKEQSKKDEPKKEQSKKEELRKEVAAKKDSPKKEAPKKEEAKKIKSPIATPPERPKKAGVPFTESAAEGTIVPSMTTASHAIMSEIIKKTELPQAKVPTLKRGGTPVDELSAELLEQIVKDDKEFALKGTASTKAPVKLKGRNIMDVAPGGIMGRNVEIERYIKETAPEEVVIPEYRQETRAVTSKTMTISREEESQPGPIEISSKQQHESEAAASDADTSQVSVSSLPEDEGTASSGLQHLQGAAGKTSKEEQEDSGPGAEAMSFIEKKEYFETLATETVEVLSPTQRQDSVESGSFRQQSQERQDMLEASTSSTKTMSEQPEGQSKQQQNEETYEIKRLLVKTVEEGREVKEFVDLVKQERQLEAKAVTTEQPGIPGMKAKTRATVVETSIEKQQTEVSKRAPEHIELPTTDIKSQQQQQQQKQQQQSHPQAEQSSETAMDIHGSDESKAKQKVTDIDSCKASEVSSELPQAETKLSSVFGEKLFPSATIPKGEATLLDEKALEKFTVQDEFSVQEQQHAVHRVAEVLTNKTVVIQQSKDSLVMQETREESPQKDFTGYDVRTSPTLLAHKVHMPLTPELEREDMLRVEYASEELGSIQLETAETIQQEKSTERDADRLPKDEAEPSFTGDNEQPAFITELTETHTVGSPENVEDFYKVESPELVRAKQSVNRSALFQDVSDEPETITEERVFYTVETPEHTMTQEEAFSIKTDITTIMEETKVINVEVSSSKLTQGDDDTLLSQEVEQIATKLQEHESILAEVVELKEELPLTPESDKNKHKLESKDPTKEEIEKRMEQMSFSSPEEPSSHKDFDPLRRGSSLEALSDSEVAPKSVISEPSSGPAAHTRVDGSLEELSIASSKSFDPEQRGLSPDSELPAESLQCRVLPATTASITETASVLDSNTTKYEALSPDTPSAASAPPIDQYDRASSPGDDSSSEGSHKPTGQPVMTEQASAKLVERPEGALSPDDLSEASGPLAHPLKRAETPDSELKPSLDTDSSDFPKKEEPCKFSKLEQSELPFTEEFDLRQSPTMKAHAIRLNEDSADRLLHQEEYMEVLRTQELEAHSAQQKFLTADEPKERSKRPLQDLAEPPTTVFQEATPIQENLPELESEKGQWDSGYDFPKSPTMKAHIVKIASEDADRLLHQDEYMEVLRKQEEEQHEEIEEKGKLETSTSAKTTEDEDSGMPTDFNIRQSPTMKAHAVKLTDEDADRLLHQDEYMEVLQAHQAENQRVEYPEETTESSYVEQKSTLSECYDIRGSPTMKAHAVKLNETEVDRKLYAEEYMEVLRKREEKTEIVGGEQQKHCSPNEPSVASSDKKYDLHARNSLLKALSSSQFKPPIKGESSDTKDFSGLVPLEASSSTNDETMPRSEFDPCQLSRSSDPEKLLNRVEVLHLTMDAELPEDKNIGQPVKSEAATIATVSTAKEMESFDTQVSEHQMRTVETLGPLERFKGIENAAFQLEDDDEPINTPRGILDTMAKTLSEEQQSEAISESSMVERELSPETEVIQEMMQTIEPKCVSRTVQFGSAPVTTSNQVSSRENHDTLLTPSSIREQQHSRIQFNQSTPSVERLSEEIRSTQEKASTIVQEVTEKAAEIVSQLAAARIVAEPQSRQQQQQQEEERGSSPDTESFIDHEKDRSASDQLVRDVIEEIAEEDETSAECQPSLRTDHTQMKEKTILLSMDDFSSSLEDEIIETGSADSLEGELVETRATLTEFRHPVLQEMLHEESLSSSSSAGQQGVSSSATMVSSTSSATSMTTSTTSSTSVTTTSQSSESSAQSVLHQSLAAAQDTEHAGQDGRSRGLSEDISYNDTPQQQQQHHQMRPIAVASIECPMAFENVAFRDDSSSEARIEFRPGENTLVSELSEHVQRQQHICNVPSHPQQLSEQGQTVVGPVEFGSVMDQRASTFAASVEALTITETTVTTSTTSMTGSSDTVQLVKGSMLKQESRDESTLSQDITHSASDDDDDDEANRSDDGFNDNAMGSDRKSLSKEAECGDGVVVRMRRSMPQQQQDGGSTEGSSGDQEKRQSYLSEESSEKGDSERRQFASSSEPISSTTTATHTSTEYETASQGSKLSVSTTSSTYKTAQTSTQSTISDGSEHSASHFSTATTGGVGGELSDASDTILESPIGPVSTERPREGLWADAPKQSPPRELALGDVTASQQHVSQQQSGQPQGDESSSPMEELLRRYPYGLPSSGMTDMTEVDDEDYEAGYHSDKTVGMLRRKRLSPILDDHGSTPDADSASMKRSLGRGSERDDMSVCSLQEFERLEAEMAQSKNSVASSLESSSHLTGSLPPTQGLQGSMSGLAGSGSAGTSSGSRLAGDLLPAALSAGGQQPADFERLEREIHLEGLQGSVQQSEPDRAMAVIREQEIEMFSSQLNLGLNPDLEANASLSEGSPDSAVVTELQCSTGSLQSSRQPNVVSASADVVTSGVQIVIPKVSTAAGVGGESGSYEDGGNESLLDSLIEEIEQHHKREASQDEDKGIEPDSLAQVQTPDFPDSLSHSHGGEAALYDSLHEVKEIGEWDSFYEGKEGSGSGEVLGERVLSMSPTVTVQKTISHSNDGGTTLTTRTTVTKMIVTTGDADEFRELSASGSPIGQDTPGQGGYISIATTTTTSPRSQSAGDHSTTIIGSDQPDSGLFHSDDDYSMIPAVGQTTTAVSPTAVSSTRTIIPGSTSFAESTVDYLIEKRTSPLVSPELKGPCVEANVSLMMALQQQRPVGASSSPGANIPKQSSSAATAFTTTAPTASSVMPSSTSGDTSTTFADCKQTQGSQLLDEMMTAAESLSTTHTNVTTRTVTEIEHDSEGYPHEKTATITTTHKVTTGPDGKQHVEKTETRS
ncbi:ankyrin-2-like isoform X4 [Varroa destructor]|uniref:Uncharacterized protein n=1 Tax=Varroa destructor TaxID=109461 RepID=A0A7M7KN55_VARDE|nr:ankyrin-2-like isoform X4 [Varroa destructor]